MTSPAYSRDAQWAPLAHRDRTWERNAPGNIPSHAHSRNFDQRDAGLDDFAAEAAYLPRNGGTKQEVRPAPPLLKAEHVWGVRDDWGKGTNTWGEGAKAYDGKQTNSSSQNSPK